MNFILLSKYSTRRTKYAVRCRFYPHKGITKIKISFGNDIMKSLNWSIGDKLEFYYGEKNCYRWMISKSENCEGFKIVKNSKNSSRIEIVSDFIKSNKNHKNKDIKHKILDNKLYINV